MDKRYQVFVSSTYKDLTDERAAVIQAILDLEHFPAGMELFPAANADQWTLIKQVIDESDYYVVVVAGRYGSVNAEGISYTEREYDYAVETKTPILGFVHGEPDRIESGKTEASATARRRLAQFRSKVESRMVKHFTTADQLGGQVTTSLVREIKNNPQIGWVRGDKAMTVETEREILRLRTDLAKAKDQLSQTERTAQAALDSSDLQQGDDITTMNLQVYSRFSNDSTNFWVQSKVSWNDVLKAIGPVMIGEATESEIEDKLELCIYRGEMSDKHREAIKEVRGLRIAIADSTLETVLVHFRMLGIIDSGIKSRTPSDTNRYLRLTPLGIEKVSTLKAVRKSGQHAAKKAPAKKTPTKRANPSR